MRQLAIRVAGQQQQNDARHPLAPSSNVQHDGLDPRIGYTASIVRPKSGTILLAQNKRLWVKVDADIEPRVYHCLLQVRGRARHKIGLNRFKF